MSETESNVTAGEPPDAIVPVENDEFAAPVDEDAASAAALKELVAKLPPAMRIQAMKLKRPGPAEMGALVSALPEKYQQPFLELLDRANPAKQGLHTDSLGFQPTVVKVYQGTGNDAARPKETIPGAMYSSDSRVIGEKLSGAVIGGYSGRTLWPPRDQGGEDGSKAPICSSADNKTGSKYGDCMSCAMRTRPAKQGGCSSNITIYIVDKDLTNVYMVQFANSSWGAGSTLLKILSREKVLWNRWFTFETKERTEKDFRWFVLQAGPDGKLGATPTELHALFGALSRLLDADVYYPAVANTYARLAAANTSAEGAPATPAFDEKAFLKGDANAVPDYSNDV